MALKCVICIEPLMSYGEEVVIDAVCLPCGHIFHCTCIDQWLLKKSSCPQCRHHCSKNGIRKLFFEYLAITKDEPESIQCLNNQVENLKFELAMVKKDNISKEEFAKGQLSKVKSLRSMIFNLEKDVMKLKSDHLSVIDSNRCLLQEIQQLNKKTHEVDFLKKELEKYRSLDSILKGSPEEADKVLNEADLDANTLKVLIASFKSALADSKRKCFNKDSIVKKLNEETMNKQSTIDSLISEVSTLERVLESYQTKVKELEFRNCNISEEIKSQEFTRSECSFMEYFPNEQSLQSPLKQSADTFHDTLEDLSPLRKKCRLSVNEPSSSRVIGKSFPTLKNKIKIVTMRRRK